MFVCNYSNLGKSRGFCFCTFLRARPLYHRGGGHFLSWKVSGHCNTLQTGVHFELWIGFDLFFSTNIKSCFWQGLGSGSDMRCYLHCKSNHATCLQESNLRVPNRDSSVNYIGIGLLSSGPGSSALHKLWRLQGKFRLQWIVRASPHNPSEDRVVGVNFISTTLFR